jgi:hypothetical protein
MKRNQNLRGTFLAGWPDDGPRTFYRQSKLLICNHLVAQVSQSGHACGEALRRTHAYRLLGKGLLFGQNVANVPGKR